MSSRPATLYTAEVELYDVAFGWDLADEADWLVERLGPACRSVLEPGCGSGRVLEALAVRGLAVVGLDRSAEMARAAEARLEAAGLAGDVVVGDMVAFELGRTFEGAVCPINTLAYLEPGELARHLDCMARHLTPGARYLVQVAMRDPAMPLAGVRTSTWEAARGEVLLNVTWAVEEVDLERARERHRSRIEVVAGDRAGEVLEEGHIMTTWTPAAWRREVDASSFSQRATYDGEQPGRPMVELGPGRLHWHELVRTPQ